MRSYKAARRAAKREQGGVAPIPFEVTYEGADGEDVTEVFNAYGEISGATLADIAYFADIDTATVEAGAIMRKTFMEAIGDDDEFGRFWRSVASSIDTDSLAEIMYGLIEDTTGRPTERPSDSPVLSSTTGQDSRVTILHGGFKTLAQPVESSVSLAESS